ncbi:acyl-CoA dehydrogenase family protein [Corynebacterium sp. S7]
MTTSVSPLSNAITADTAGLSELSSTNWAQRDPALAAVVNRWIGPEIRSTTEDYLTHLGEDAVRRLAPLATTADKNPPVLRQFDREGERIDEVICHPSYLELNTAAYEEYGLAGLSHRPVAGFESAPPHIVKYLASYLFVQAEFGLACPVSMTDAAARTLRMFGDPEVFGPYIDGLTSTETGRLTGAMFMTEPQAGTDIAQTDTRAQLCEDDVSFGYEGAGQGWLLTGRKWFASNPDADVIITLAKYPGGPENSTRGVGMFMIPKTLPNGKRNNHRINKLKDKLGTRSMPSGDVTLEGTWAIQVGELDRGFRQMAEMLNTSRLSNAMRASALMRRSIRDAADHTRNRVVFGKALFDQPLMRATLLPLFLEAEGSLALIGYAADTLRRSDEGDEAATPIIRLLTPMAKHYVCKRARSVTGEAMEIRGGNGYIEDWDFARLLRDSHLGSIWEGSSNVIALDVLRCMNKMDSHRHLAAAMHATLSSLSDECAPTAQALISRWENLEARGVELLAMDNDVAQMLIGRYTDELARAVIAVQLLDLADNEIRTNGNYRSLLVAQAYLDDIEGEFHAGALENLDSIVEGTPLSADEINTKSR